MTMKEQKITPWEVGVEIEDEMRTIDYSHVIKQFGVKEFGDNQIDSLKGVVKDKIHHLFTRKIVFAHRDFDSIVECLRKGEKFFLYTGRGPSSDSMHIGHAIPFIIAKYLQKEFSVPLLIQMTDDEKFLFSKNDASLETITQYMHSNIKDIIAFGLDPNLTYIFGNHNHAYPFNANVTRISRTITLNEAKKVFGFTEDSKIGQIAFPAKQIAPCFPSSFEFLDKSMKCLIPAAIDQDPYFRLCREKAEKLGENKPASIYVSLLPDLRGPNRKMSASDPTSSIYLSDTPEIIADKIRKYAFSGGQSTLSEHKRLGGDTNIDVAYQYLRFFYEDDNDLEKIRKEYESGVMTTSTLKNKCIEVVQEFIAEYQKKRASVTDELVSQFFNK